MIDTVALTSKYRRTFILLILLLVISSHHTAVDAIDASNNPDLCCLCDGCEPILFGRASHFLDENGMTCARKALNLARENGSSDPNCLREQRKYQSECCDRNYEPTEIKQAGTDPNAELNSYPKGNEPVCNICPDGLFPEKPNTVTALLYIPGTPTCKDLYYMGLRGTFPDRLCKPAQDYFQKPCGCNPH